MTLRYLSVCSGIEAATVAWHPLGWTPFGFAEIEAFPSAVLAHHYGSNLPGEKLTSNGVPNFGNMECFNEWPDADIDVLVGGTPCQSFSVAGLRKGLADPRGNLALVYLGIVDRYRPKWFVWENVPGVLSSNGGRDFGSFLGGIQQLGYGFSYRVLDAQYIRVDGFGRAVPQRRRRVFVVGNSTDWRRAAAVLFEPESMSGNPAPRRETGKDVAPTISARTKGGGGLGTDFDCDGGLVAGAICKDSFSGGAGGRPEGAAAGHFLPVTLSSTGDVAHCLNAGGMGRQDYETETVIAHALRADGFDASEDGTGRGTSIIPVVAASLTRGAESSGKGGYAGRRQEDDVNIVALQTHAIQAGAVRENPDSGPDGVGVQADAAYTLEARAEVQAVQSGWAVRRLTPLECERLQAFPDGYTVAPFRGKPAADGPRYKALGNSMAVNAMRWLGRRIEYVNGMVACDEKM